MAHKIEKQQPKSDQIQTPVFDSLLRDQGIPSDAIQWIYVFLGRIFTPMHLRDDRWEVSLMLHGVAGTGKSTLLELIRGLFAQHRVLCIGQQQQQQQEIDENIQLVLDPDLQELGTTEADLDRYRKTNLVVSTNNTFNNTTAAVARSFIVIDFPKQVKHPDPHLATRLQGERWLLYDKCRPLYRHAAQQFAHRPPVLPAYFKTAHTAAFPP